MTKRTRFMTWTIALACCLAAHAQTRPNIVFMLSDDQHWDESAVPMHPDSPYAFRDELHTPRLQALAKQGMRFSDAYAPASVCAPTRISLQTGMSPAALHWTKAGPSINASKNPRMLPPTNERAIKREYVTFAELLQDAGYTTAHFGKWHLNGNGPESHGYDVSDGNIGNEASGKYKAPNPVDLFGMAKRAESFMAKAKEQGKPFFIQLSWLALHSPENALPETIAKYQSLGRGRSVNRAALTENMDTAVGRVLDSIDKLGLGENTYVVFMSDNGGNSRDGLNGGKGNLYEGGIRVPLIVRGPGVEADSWSHVPVVGFDLYPTFLQWAGIEVPGKVEQVIEGGSIAGLLSGQADEVQRRYDGLAFHFPHYQTHVGPHSTIRVGDYKLFKFYQTGSVRLYNLADDLREQNDLSTKLPDLAKRLEQQLADILSELDAQMPTINEQYDPDKPTEIDRGPREPRERR